MQIQLTPVTKHRDYILPERLEQRTPVQKQRLLVEAGMPCSCSYSFSVRHLPILRLPHEPINAHTVAGKDSLQLPHA